MGEVNYFSTKSVVEKNIESPKIIIPSIGVDEKINNESLNYGVLSDPGENIPTKEALLLFGHRTLQGSPFLRLKTTITSYLADTFAMMYTSFRDMPSTY